MTSDLSQLGGFARSSVLELARTGYQFAGVENGIVRVISPTGQPFEFTNDAYAGTSVCTWQSDPFVDSVSTDDGDFAASLGGAQLAPVYDDTSADDTPALDSPEWDADAELEAALVEMFDADPADNETPDPAPILCEITDLGAGPYGGCPPPANLAGCEDAEIAEAIAQAPACATTHEAATLAFVELGFDRATAEGMGAAAAAAGLHPTSIDLIATQLLDEAPEPVTSHSDRMPREIACRITVKVTRIGRRRFCVCLVEALRGYKVVKSRELIDEVPPTMPVDQAEANMIAGALRNFRKPSDISIHCSVELGRRFWILSELEGPHSVVWYTRILARRTRP